MCWRSPATIRSEPPAAPGALTLSSSGSRREPGSASRPGRAPRATATTTGRSSARTQSLATRPGSAGSCCAAAAPLVSWPSTAAGGPARCRWPCWSGGRPTLEHRRAHQDQQRPGRSGPASAPPLALLVPLGHPGHGCPRLLGRGGPDQQHPPPATPKLISLTCNEVQHLVAALLTCPAADPAHRLRWSLWRRRQQARARTRHYHRQANGP
jgi:hypothetical protein